MSGCLYGTICMIEQIHRKKDADIRKSGETRSNVLSRCKKDETQKINNIEMEVL